MRERGGGVLCCDCSRVVLRASTLATGRCEVALQNVTVKCSLKDLTYWLCGYVNDREGRKPQLQTHTQAILVQNHFDYETSFSETLIRTSRQEKQLLKESVEALRYCV